MKTFRTLFPMLGVALTLAACSGESTGNAGAESASSAQTKAVADDGRPGAGRPHHGPGGPGMLLFAALHEDIKLTPEQKAKLESLVASNRPEPPAVDKTRTSQLASAVRSGKIDAATLQPPKEAMESAHKEHAAKLATSLTTLHDTLSKEQRVALVDAVKAKAASHGPWKGKEGKEGRPPHAEGHGPGAMGPMAHLLGGLDLTDAQKEQIKTKLEANRPAPPSDADREAMKAKFESMKKDMEAKLESFKADAFDANAFVTPPAGLDKPQGHADRMATDLQIVVSVLDQAQREKLAAKIEQGPPARPMRH